MPNLIHGQNPGGALTPIQVDDNGNLVVDLISGISVSATVDSNNTLIVNQVSGSTWSIAAGSTLGVDQVSGATWSIAATTSLLVDQLSGSSWSAAVVSGATSLDVKQVSGSSDSVAAQGIARTTNPAAVADTVVTNVSTDDLGRLVITPYQVRDLLTSAYVTTSTGVETTLGTAVAGAYLDLVQVVCSNESGAAVDVDFRAVTAGNVEFSITIPANATAGFIPVVPWPQGNTGNNWTMDVSGSDVSNTTVNVAALFIRNV